jgi:hypothetical protein
VGTCVVGFTMGENGGFFIDESPFLVDEAFDDGGSG